MGVTARRVRDGDSEGYRAGTETGVGMEGDWHVEVLDVINISR